MPRLTEASKAARRAQIAQAALTCIARDGVAGTSMADIIKESGLSSGSIYSHFDGKEALVRFAATTMLEAQTAIADEVGEGNVITPRELAERLAEKVGAAFPGAALLQVWGEIARDPDLRAVAGEVLASVRDLHTHTLTPWAAGIHDDADTARRLAQQSTDAVLAVLQGAIVRRTIDETVDPGLLVRTLTAGLDGLEERLPVT